MASYERNSWKSKSKIKSPSQEIKIDKTIIKTHNTLLKNLTNF